MLFSDFFNPREFDPKSLVTPLNGMLNAILGVFFVKGERTIDRSNIIKSKNHNS